MKEFDPVIGLEVHLQLNTQTKIFCSCPTTFGAPANTLVCPVCLGMPGSLPVLNAQVLASGIKVALGLNCSVQSQVVFHRKNYFYPDLPKGYQISQFDLPIGEQGHLEIDGKKIRINRVHMEEDAGKSIHKTDEPHSLVDCNRAGVPLLEIVSEADMGSAEEAYAYLQTLKATLQYLEVSDCDMEKGSLRCDANVSLVTGGKWGTKVEVKNLNSFKAVRAAINYEIVRQREIIEDGGSINQETRLWDEDNNLTQGMRGKEFAHDYRYFPEPDLPPFAVDPDQVEQIRSTLPEMPKEKQARFVESFGLPEADAKTLTASLATARYYESAIAVLAEQYPDQNKPEVFKLLANWMLSDIAREINERHCEDIYALDFPPGHLVELVSLIQSEKISGKMGKKVFVSCLEEKTSPAKVVEAKGMSQVTDKSTLVGPAEEVLAEQAQAVEEFKSGKETVLMFLVGQLMKKTKGAASPQVAQEVLRDLLQKS